MIEIRYVPMKEICPKAKDIDSLEYAFAHKTCSLALRLKNGTFRFVNSSEELNIVLSKVFDICFPVFTRLSPLIFSKLKIISELFVFIESAFISLSLKGNS